MNKRVAVLLTVILAVSALLVAKPAPALAQSVPEFTLKLEAYPYDVPPKYAIDPYTGKNVTVQEGYHAENKSIVVTIKNQLAPSTLYYNVRSKGHFGDTWTEHYTYGLYSTVSLPSQSDSEYTVLLIPAVYPFTNGSRVDFQVEAQLWHNVEVFISDHPTFPAPYNEIGHYEQRFMMDTTSGWSSTQTITIEWSDTPSSPSPKPTPDQTSEPAQNESSQTLHAAAILGTVVAVVLAGSGLLLYRRKLGR